MKQYNDIKSKYPDTILLFRVGDFYETFGEDAILASKILGIVLTKRGAGSSSEVELAGFPHHSIENYRAIPWVFGWAQTRNTLTGWYGSGTALQHVIEKYGIEEVRRIYNNSEFLKNLISNIEMTIFKSDLKISKLYVNSLLDKENITIYEKIVNESNLVKTGIKKIKNTNELLSDNKVLKNTLNIRNAYLDPLSLIQITLMQKMKNSTLADEEKKALLLSINGLAAGLRNTG